MGQKQKKGFEHINLNQEAAAFVARCGSLEVIYDLAELKKLSAPVPSGELFNVDYVLPSGECMNEAHVANVKNGISVNFYDEYMRRRDPDTMLIGDHGPTDKPRFKDAYHKEFSTVREETFEWLIAQELIAVPFISGNDKYGVHSLAFVPKNAAFFAFGLGLLQGTVDPKSIKGFKPRCFVYVAPPFRHTHFKGKQIVVHNRSMDNYEVFSYNLYPGPSAKKGTYGVLLYFGEMEGWVTNHAAVVKVTTPYGNKLTIMHEGASGGGKSEINQHIHREFDGSVMIGHNVVTKEKEYLTLPKGCTISPVVDDMASAHLQVQDKSGKLGVVDAENGWFIRVDHITQYGTDPDIESRSIHPKSPLLFLNIDAAPGSTALLWEPIRESSGKPCSNPRVIIPKNSVDDIITKPVYVDIRSFGVRTPPYTPDEPSYGVIGLCQILPPAIAWIWRLVSPRGFDNPSIISTKGMSSEGVGSYWPFATGKKVPQANLLLKQIMDNPDVHYVLCPVKHIGAWHVGFMPEWIMREYFSRKGGVHFRKEDITFSGSTLLGYTMNEIIIEGQALPEKLLKAKKQPEVGEQGFKKGTKILTDYFKKELEQFLEPGLDPLGRKIINAFLKDASIEEMESLIPSKSIYIEE